MPVTPSSVPTSVPRSVVSSRASVDRETHHSSDRQSVDSRLRRPFQTKTNIPNSGRAPRLSTVSVKSVRREHRPRASSVVRNGVLATDMLNIARANVQSNQSRMSSERSETVRSVALDAERSASVGRRMGSLEPEPIRSDGTRRRHSSSLLLSSPVERKYTKPVVHLDGFAEEFENDLFGFGLAEHIFKSQPAKKPLRPRVPDPVVVDVQTSFLDLPSTPSSQASPPEDPLSDPEVIQKIVEGSRNRRPSSGRIKTPTTKPIKRGRDSAAASKEPETVSRDNINVRAQKDLIDTKASDTRALSAQGQDNELEEGDIIIIPRRKPKPRTVPTRASARLATGHQVVVEEKETLQDPDRTPTRPKPRARVRPSNQVSTSRALPRTTAIERESRPIEERAQSIQSLDSDDLYT